MDDSIIVDLFLSRDESAISLTAEKYGSKLRKIAYGILGSESSAEECENETYLEAWNLIPPYEPRTYLFPFLGKIIRHLAIDEYRKAASQKRDAPVSELTREIAECIPGKNNVEAAVDAKELTRAIDVFLESCTCEQRNLFVRRYWYFDSISDISKRYGYSQSKVKTALFRLREALRKHLEKEGYTI